MLEKPMKVIVKNVTPGDEPYVVARYSGNELWYYGRWKHYKDALVVAEEVDGIVVEEMADTEDDRR